jgi:DNA polymerase III epsilon subunit-like protein
MYIYFADTETTGKPKDYKAPITDSENWPRIIQLSGEVWTYPERKCVKQVDHFVYPEGWEMPTDKFWKEHGFSQQKSLREGKPIRLIMEEQIRILNHVDLVVFHNAKFDWLIMLSELHRAGMPLEKRPVIFDTMEKSRGITKIKNPNSPGWKAPKLEELYKHFFKRPMIGAHNSMFDVVAARQIFFRMVDIKILDPVKYINYEQSKQQKLSGPASGSEAEGKKISDRAKEGGPEQGKLF